MTDGTSIGARVRTALETAGMTQTEFAALAGTSNGYVSEICRNVKKPSVEVLAALVVHLQFSGTWLLAGIGPPTITDEQPEQDKLHSLFEQVLLTRQDAGPRLRGYLEAMLAETEQQAGRRTA